ncbi:MAG: phosphoribosylaminoimidazolesuccinocarboxamide synthase [Oscillospiraceae bacterium]|nr:phosphoribosylaminoimidazolesuccinocarboxamide synthase [Oscillospiraceae bacterium]
MKHVYTGKTKDVYELDDGNYLFKFKDDACGENGVFDPGANQIIGKIDGKGMAGLAISEYFFNRINSAGYPTHFIGCDVNKGEMKIRPAKNFGNGIEVICRYKATGSFIRRYGAYIKDGESLDALVEITLKDDERGDPFITRETLVALNILTLNEHDELIILMKNIVGIIKNEISAKGMELIDIKLEFGKDKNGKIMLIDEVSADIMRVYKNGKSVEPLEFTKIMLGDTL